jgi:succinate dehydrogenase / fumarate reductase flavoprotein subunit
MQGLSDGYFVISSTLGHYLASNKLDSVGADHAEARKTQGEVEDRLKKLLGVNGKRTADNFHRELGDIMWNKCGMSRDRTGLEWALQRIPELREEFWKDVVVPGDGGLNQSLEKAGRVADLFEFAELMCLDALEREESCGGHFREEYQDEGEAKRNDESYSYAAAWQFEGVGKRPTLHKEPLTFNYVKPTQRSYK